MSVFYKISDIEKYNNVLGDSYSKNRKLTRKDFDYLKKIIDQMNLENQYYIMNIPELRIENDFLKLS